ncbi:MAG: hypothetical protein FWG69_02495 [Oscillospiraceae bacterium]|nr:hypothetical protein [Oscillospiraceae bacterium]
MLTGTMMFESVAILIVLALVSIIFMRAKKYGYVFCTIPLGIVPLANILLVLLKEHIKVGVNISDFHYSVTMIVTLALCCLLLGFMSGVFRLKSNRILFMSISSAFVVTLTLIYIFK